MYQQGYNQSYDQRGSYSQYGSQYAGFDSRGPSYDVSSAPRIVLDEYNSDLNFVIEPDGVTGSSLHKDGFEYMWAGARATHGVRSGKVKLRFYYRILSWIYSPPPPKCIFAVGKWGGGGGVGWVRRI